MAEVETITDDVGLGFRPRSKKRMKSLTPKSLKFCEEYAKTSNATRSYMQAYGLEDYQSAAANASKLIKQPLVRQQIRNIIGVDSKVFTPSDIKYEFRAIYDSSKSEHVRIRILENLAKIEGMFIEKTVNLNANLVQELPNLKDVPIDQLETEFIKRMKLEHTGVDTFKRLQMPVEQALAQAESAHGTGSEHAPSANVAQMDGVGEGYADGAGGGGLE